MPGKFENSRNTFVRVNSHEHVFAKKPEKRMNPKSRTTRLLVRYLTKHKTVNKPNKIVCTSAVIKNCSSVTGIVEEEK